MNANFTSFPLYTTIKQKISKTDCKRSLTETNIKSFLAYFKKIDKIGYERFFVLIRHYQIDNNELTSFTLPYNGKKLKKGIRFDIKNFPPMLQHILLEFLKIHSKSNPV